MLTHLQIRDFAIVESVELELRRGFTALTGETGAGKSILVDALLLAVGGRADSGAVRHGAERAEVTASFAVAGNAPALAWLDEQQVAHDGEVVLRRSVGTDGRSRAYVNGQAMAAQALRALGELLVDVHGQLEFQSLARRGYQRELLDESGRLLDETGAMRAAFRRWRELDLQREAFAQRGRDREDRLDLLAHYAAELEALDPKADEPQRLGEERRRMAALGGSRRDGPARATARGRRGDVAAALGRAQALVRQLAILDPRSRTPSAPSRRRPSPAGSQSPGFGAMPTPSRPTRHGRNGSKHASRRSRPPRASTVVTCSACRAAPRTGEELAALRSSAVDLADWNDAWPTRERTVTRPRDAWAQHGAAPRRRSTGGSPN